MKKIILVFPGKKGMVARIPLPLLSIAEPLVRRNYPVEIIDLRIQSYKEVDLSNALCVGLTTWSGSMIKYALEFAQHVRNVNPSIPLVWGGVHVSLLPEQTINHPLVDIACMGEGEDTFLELVEHLQIGKSLREVKGLIYKDKDEIVKNLDRPFIDLNQIGPLPYDLLKIDCYPVHEMFTYMSSRGCPHKCIFCYNLSYNKGRYRTRDVSKVLDDLEIVVKKFNPESIDFADDDFFVDKKRVQKLSEGFIERGFKFKWQAGCRVDYFKHFSKEFLLQLKTSGLISLGMGAESGSDEILEFTLKGISAAEILNATRICKEVGIELTYSFIAGFPDETRPQFYKTLDIIDEIWKIDPEGGVNGLFLLTCYPGTPIFEIAREKGFKLPISLDEWAMWKFGDKANTPWHESGFKGEIETASSIVRFFYFRKQLRFYGKHHKITWFSKIFIVNLYQLLSPVLYPFALMRWKHRWFKYGFEWRIWAFARNMILGHH